MPIFAEISFRSLAVSFGVYVPIFSAGQSVLDQGNGGVLSRISRTSFSISRLKRRSCSHSFFIAVFHK
jgi:hypothetical protein